MAMKAKKSSRRTSRPKAANRKVGLDLASDVKRRATKAVKQGRKFANSAYGMASHMADRLPHAADMMPDTRRIQRMADTNPMLLGAIGLGIGLVVGAFMPNVISGSRNNAPAGRTTTGNRRRAAPKNSGRAKTARSTKSGAARKSATNAQHRNGTQATTIN